MKIRQIVAVVLAFITALLLAHNASQAQPSCYTGLWERSSVVDMTIELRYELKHAEIIDGYGAASTTSIFLPVMLPPSPAPCTYNPQVQVASDSASTSSLLSGSISANSAVFGFDTLSPQPASFANAELGALLRRITTRLGGEFGNAYYVISNVDGTFSVPPASFISKIAISGASVSTNVTFAQDQEVLPPGEYFEVIPVIRVTASVRFLDFDSIAGFLSACSSSSSVEVICECRSRYGSICDYDTDPFNDIQPAGPANGMQAMAYAFKGNSDSMPGSAGNIWNGVFIVDSAGSSRTLGVFSGTAFNVTSGNMPETTVDFVGSSAYTMPGETSQSFSVDAFRVGDLDADRNNTIDWADRNFVLGAVGSDTGDLGYSARADYNLDGVVTYTDFTEYVHAWLVSAACPGDYNVSGSATVQDIFDFLADWFSGIATADINGMSGISVQDIFDFLSLWFAGC